MNSNTNGCLRFDSGHECNWCELTWITKLLIPRGTISRVKVEPNVNDERRWCTIHWYHYDRLLLELIELRFVASWTTWMIRYQQCWCFFCDQLLADLNISRDQLIRQNFERIPTITGTTTYGKIKLVLTLLSNNLHLETVSDYLTN